MNSLEFIDKEIKRYKTIIIGIKAMLKEPKTEDVIKFLKNDLKEYEEKVSHLQQIKAELEADDKDQKELSEFRKMLQEQKDYIFDLEQNVNSLEEECVTLVSKLEFYKRTVSFIKELFFADIIELENGYFKIGFAPKEPIKNTRFTDIPTIMIAKHLQKALEVKDESN